MAQDLNSVMLVGRLARDIEMNQTGTVGRISLVSSTNEKQQDGSWKDVPNYFTVNLFGKRAQALQQYLTKGVQIGVNGTLRYNAWQGSDGQKHSAIVINANDIQLLSRPQNQNNGQQSGNYQQPQQNYQQAVQQGFQTVPQQQMSQPVAQQPIQQTPVNNNGFNAGGFTEDIPF